MQSRKGAQQSAYNRASSAPLPPQAPHSADIVVIEDTQLERKAAKTDLMHKAGYVKLGRLANNLFMHAPMRAPPCGPSITHSPFPRFSLPAGGFDTQTLCRGPSLASTFRPAGPASRCRGRTTECSDCG